MDRFEIGKGVHQGCIFNFYESTSSEMPGWKKHKLELRLPREISTTSDMQTYLYIGSCVQSQGTLIISKIQNQEIQAKVRNLGHRVRFSRILLLDMCSLSHFTHLAACQVIKHVCGISLVVQWLRLCASDAGVQGTRIQSLIREIRSHMPWGAPKKQTNKQKRKHS